MSKRVQFLGSYLSDGATASSSTGSAAGYDPQAVVELERATGWKAPSTAAVRLILDLGSAKSPTGVGIVGGNYSAWGTTNLQHSPDGTTWTTSEALTGFPADGLDYFADVASISRRYWCLHWAAPSAAPEVDVFYLGTLTELPENPLLGAPGEDEDNVLEEKTTSGSINSEEFGRMVETLGLSWRLTAANFATVRALFRAERRARPFFWVPRDDSGSGASGQAYLVRQSSRFRWEEVYTGLFECATTLREEA
jgi:hypothetical protein